MARICQTPGTIYRHQWSSNRIDGKGNMLNVSLIFPFDAESWLSGSSALREPTKDELTKALGKEDARRLYLYDQRDVERKRLSDLIHDHLEPVGADCYRAMREIDARLGTSVVADGVAWSALTRAERSAKRRAA